LRARNLGEPRGAALLFAPQYSRAWLASFLKLHPPNLSVVVQFEFSASMPRHSEVPRFPQRDEESRMAQPLPIPRLAASEEAPGCPNLLLHLSLNAYAAGAFRRTLRSPEGSA
jgi:hypothetical protein